MHDQERGERFSDDDDKKGRYQRPRVADHAERVEQHSDRHEEQHGKGIAQRQRFLRRARTERRFPQHHPGKERAQRQRHIEQLGRSECDAERNRQHGEPEQFARSRVRNVMQDPRDQPSSHDQHERDEQRDLDGRQQQDTPEPEFEVGAEQGDRCGDVPGLQIRKRWNQDEREHHGQVFDDQPADGDAAASRLHQAALLQRAEQNDGTGHRQRQSEDKALADLPLHQHGEPKAHHRGHRDLDDGARYRDGFDGQQVLQREVQAHAEHQKDDAEFREFRRQRLVGDVTRRERTHGDAGEQIANQRGYLQPLGDGAKNKSEPEARNDGCDQRCIVRHIRVLAQPTPSCAATK